MSKVDGLHAGEVNIKASVAAVMINLKLLYHFNCSVIRDKVTRCGPMFWGTTVNICGIQDLL
jgi:hypothetical protein